MKIGVVGSINIDQVVIASRIPLVGETILGESIEIRHGGKGANQAVALARLGASVIMFAKVGDDENGKLALENLKDNEVDISCIEIEKNINTGFAAITVGSNDNTIVVISGANSKVDKKYIDNHLSEIIKCDAIILQNEIPYETNEYVIDICNKNQIKVIYNPAPAKDISSEIIDKVDYLTPNQHEFEIIFPNEKIDDALSKYSNKLLVTMGDEGVKTYIEDRGIITVPCRKNCKIVDTTGAGDTFNAAFVYAIMNNYEKEKAIRFASIAAGLSIEKLGAQSGMPYIEDVLKEI